MRAPVLALLAALLPATYARAEGIVVERGVDASGTGVTVSWHLPPGFDESELLIEVDGGPRVRLTDEFRDRNPRVLVELPALAGSARFVVRAGRPVEGRRRNREEVDVEKSERFALADLPTTGHVPVRAAATRPLPGAVMEWWADATGRPVEGPSATLESPIAAREAERLPASPALPSSRPQPAASPAEASSGLGKASPDAPPAIASGARERAFPGATTPLRN